MKGEVVDKARILRKNLTDAERALWKHLRLRQMRGCKSRRQQPIGPYSVDFVCFDNRMVVELDGGQHTKQADYDSKRIAWLNKQGFQVLRFWDNEVLKILRVLSSYYGENVPPPTSILPRKGGGRAVR